MLEIILKRLDRIEAQQRALCTYIQQRDIVLRKSLQCNFAKPIEPFPPFPQMAFGPWAAHDEDHTTAGRKHGSKSQDIPSKSAPSSSNSISSMLESILKRIDGMEA